MNENTPAHKKKLNFKDNEKLKLNSINTPIELNKYYDNLLIPKFNYQKFKTIVESRKNNNNNNNSINKKEFNDSILTPQNLYINTYEFDVNPNKIENNLYNDKKVIIDYKKKTNSTPKNRNNKILENNNANIFSKSSNNLSKKNNKNKLKGIIDNNNINTNENFADNEKSKSDEDSENLSKLAEDLLSISDDYQTQQMRKSPINKKDFIGESKVYFNINNQIEQNYSKDNINLLNMENINPVPKLQSQIYISPLQKLNLNFKNINYINKIFNMKNSNENKNNINNNISNNEINNINNDNIGNYIKNNEVNNYNLNDSRENEEKKFTKLKYHVSSNSIVNNNNSIQISNYSMLNNINFNNQIMNNNPININNLFSKTAITKHNKNILDLSSGIYQDMNNSNVNPNSSMKKKNNFLKEKNINFNNMTGNSNRNNYSVGKEFNTNNKIRNSLKKNIDNYSGYNHKTNVINNFNQTFNNNINNINFENNKNIKNNIKYINNNNNNYNNLKNINNFNNNNMNNMNNINNINNVKSLNNQNFKKINDQRIFNRKIELDNNNNQIKLPDNNRYVFKQQNNVDLNNINLNDINNNINLNNNITNNNYSYEKINIFTPKNTSTNKSFDKNEHSHKNRINIPPQNFLRTSDYQKIVEYNLPQNYNEGEGKISFNTSMPKFIQRNSFQSKSQNRKQFNEINYLINNASQSPGNNRLNYVNANVNDMENIPNFQDLKNIEYIDDINENKLLKSFQPKKLNNQKNSNIDNNQFGYINQNIYTYKGKNNRTNIINKNYIKNDPIEISEI